MYIHFLFLVFKAYYIVIIICKLYLQDIPVVETEEPEPAPEPAEVDVCDQDTIIDGEVWSMFYLEENDITGKFNVPVGASAANKIFPGHSILRNLFQFFQIFPEVMVSAFRSLRHVFIGLALFFGVPG